MLYGRRVHSGIQSLYDLSDRLVLDWMPEIEDGLTGLDLDDRTEILRWRFYAFVYQLSELHSKGIKKICILGRSI